MKITFRGAAGAVTGSLHELEVDGKHFLLDCGMHQGRRREAERLNRDFAFPARSIEAVILSHAHIDHSGRLHRPTRPPPPRHTATPRCRTAPAPPATARSTASPPRPTSPSPRPPAAARGRPPSRRPGGAHPHPSPCCQAEPPPSERQSRG